MNPHDRARQELYDELWDAIVEVRDAYPRSASDAPSDEIVEAVLEVIFKETW